MTRTLVAALALAATAAAYPVSASAGDGLPPKAAPPGLQSIDGSSGGRLVTGTVAGVGSSQAALLAGLARLRGYYDGRAHLAGVVQSTDGTTTIGGFTARLHGTPVQGAVVSVYAPGMPARIAMLYDRSGHFAQSVQPLFTRFEQIVKASAPRASTGAPAGAAAVPPLHDVRAQDGTVSASIPAGWRVETLAEGVFAATGPDGAEVDQEVAVNFVDPRSPMARSGQAIYHVAPYPAGPTQALLTMARLLPNASVHVERSVNEAVQAGGLRVAQVAGTQHLRNGVEGRFIGLVGLSPMNQYGGWSVFVKLMAAPASTFGRELPTLSAIFSSYLVNQSNRQGQVQRNIADNQRLVNTLVAKNQEVQARNTAVFNASMQNARNVQNSIDRSTAGFVQYLNGTTTVQSTTNGATATVDQGFASSMVRQDPSAFREVPVSQYQQGTNF